MKRREFLKAGALFLSGASTLGGCSLSGPVRFISAHNDHQGRFFIAGIDALGRKVFSLPVDSRGHGMAVNPAYPHTAVYVSRRPGTQLHQVDLTSGELLAEITAGKYRHFVGHAYFSAGGEYLFTPENNYKKGQGVISVRDAQSLQVLGEMPSYGIGPHELHLLSDGKTLVVANGGILTQPSQPRKKLNLDTMQSSLVYIDVTTGKLQSEYRLPDQQQSIRHLDVAEEDTVVCGVQYQGSRSKAVPLIYQHSGEQELQPMHDYDWLSLKQYTGSVTFSEQSDLLVVSGPRAHKLTLWDSAQQKLLKEYNLYDACGVAWNGSHFIVTTGTGFVYQLNVTSLALTALRQEAGVKWDNHLVAV